MSEKKYIVCWQKPSWFKPKQKGPLSEFLSHELFRRLASDPNMLVWRILVTKEKTK